MSPPGRTRRPRALLGLLAAAGVAGCRIPVPERLEMQPIQFQLSEAELPSGLRLVVERDARTPLVAVVTAVSAGAAHDPPGREGLAHLVEHLTYLSRGADGRTLERRLERAGAVQHNALTDFDLVLYFEVGPREALEELVTMAAHRLESPLERLREEDLERVRDVVISELHERSERHAPAEIIGWVQEGTFAEGHPYRRPLGGTDASLEAITLPEAQAFARRRYGPANATLLVVGDLHFQAMPGILERALPESLKAPAAALPAPGGPRRVAVPAPGAARPREPAVRQGNVKERELWVGWPVPGVEGEAAQLLPFLEGIATVMAETAALRSEGTLKDPAVSLMPGAGASLLVLRAAVREGKTVQQAADQLFRGLNAMAGFGSGGAFRDGVMARIKTGVVMDLARSAEHLVTRGILRARSVHLSGDLASFTRMEKRLVDLHGRAVIDFALESLRRERAFFLEVLPRPEPPPAGAGAGPADGAAPRPAEVLEAPAPARPSGPDLATVRSLTLKNGLEVWIVPRPGWALATVAVSFHGGQAAGVGPAELAWHVGDRWDSQYGGTSGLGIELERAFRPDEVRYQLSGAAGNVANMLAILSERVRTVRVDDLGDHLLRRYWLEDIREEEARPASQAARRLRELLYAGHALARAPTASVLEQTRADEALQWLRDTHHPANGVLAIAGNVDPVQVERLARTLFENWEDRGPLQEVLPLSVPNPPEAGDAAPVLLPFASNPSSRVQVTLACRLPPCGEEGSDAVLEVAAEMLSSRLGRTLRAALGITYGVESRVERLRGGAATLHLDSSVAAGGLPQALEVIRGAIAALSRGELLPHEVEVAQAAVLRRYPARFVTDAQWVEAILSLRNRGLPVQALADFPSRVLAVDAGGVAGAMGACAATPPILSLVGNGEAIRAVTQAAPAAPAARSP